MRMGCALFQDGNVLVEKRECTRAMNDLKSSRCRSLKYTRTCVRHVHTGPNHRPCSHTVPTHTMASYEARLANRHFSLGLLACKSPVAGLPVLRSLLRALMCVRL